MADTEQRTAPVDDERAWRAVCERDSSLDGLFFYAVETTGVFCKPSCGSRRPTRGNVRFFAAAGDAMAAGFRACKRCRPGDDGPSAIERAVDEASRLLRDEGGEALTLGELSSRVGVSPWHLAKAFRARVGLSPRQLQMSLRLARLKGAVREGRAVTEATYEAGFGSSRAVHEQARRELGMSPSAYAKGGERERVVASFGRSWVGGVLVASTARGVCAVYLGDDERALRDELAGELPRAEIVHGDAQSDPLLAAVIAALSGERVDLPALDLRCSDFERIVYRALCQIAPGETRTYAELARAIGRPSAVRAVARACARNEVSVLVPCHRVIGRDGSLRGYRWGIERKKALLERERGEGGRPSAQEGGGGEGSPTGTTDRTKRAPGR